MKNIQFFFKKPKINKNVMEIDQLVKNKKLHPSNMEYHRIASFAKTTLAHTQST
jgi:hypothetical protein